MKQTANAAAQMELEWNCPTPTAAPVIFQSGPKVRGIGMCQRVGKDCLTVVTNEAHLPGQCVMVRLAEPVVVADAATTGTPMELKARVEWCRPAKNGRGYTAGLRVIQDVPEACSLLVTLRMAYLARSN